MSKHKIAKKMFIKEYILPIFIFALIYINIAFNIFRLPDYARFWDEGLTILIAALVLIITPRNLYSKIKIPLLLLGLMVIIGLCGNATYGYTTAFSFIARDIVVFLKFPLTFLLLSTLVKKDIFSMNSKRILLFLLELAVVIIALFGIINLFFKIDTMLQDEVRFGIRPYQFLFAHPSGLVLAAVLSICLIDSIDKNKRRRIIFDCLCLLIIVLTMRTKGFVFVALYLVVNFIYKYFYKYRKVLFIIIPVVAIIASAYKIIEYSTYDTTPRGSLYKGAIALAADDFPFGSGFASFGSDLSVRADSKVYNQIDISFYYHNDVLVQNIYDDAGLAFYLGEFGFIGFMCFLIILIMISRIALRGVDGKINGKELVPILVLMLYLIIAVPAEAVFTNNGLEIAIVLFALMRLRNNKKAEMIR